MITRFASQHLFVICHHWIRCFAWVSIVIEISTPIAFIHLDIVRSVLCFKVSHFFVLWLLTINENMTRLKAIGAPFVILFFVDTPFLRVTKLTTVVTHALFFNELPLFYLLLKFGYAVEFRWFPYVVYTVLRGNLEWVTIQNLTLDSFFLLVFFIC